MPNEPIQISATIVVRDFAAKLGLPVTRVVAELMKNGVMASVNQEIDFDTASIIATDLGKEVTLFEAAAPEAETVVNYLQEDESTDLQPRAPVVVVMGHVDHGKTSLLDAIRKANVVEGEAGGITQHIGAYQVEAQGRAITFLDTPGHEAFTQMRSRGAKVADVAILVVAGDDGIKPQTTESHRMIMEAGLPFIVAITKIDKEGSNPDRVKKELAEQNILAEEYGGKVPFVLVSAKTKQGIEDVLESVVLLADVEASKLRVNATRPAVGTIIESHIDPKQGALCSALVQTGTLKLGDEIIVGQVWGKVRSMKNDRGELVKVAGPSMAVQILGLKAAPQVGDIFRVDAEAAQSMKKHTKSHQLGFHTQTVVSRSATAMNATNSSEGTPEVKKLFVLLKSDTLGSAEAILESLKKLEHPEVAVEIIQRGLGIVSEADVLRAEAAKAMIIGFHVPVSQKAEQLGRSKDIEILSYDVIYNLIDEVTIRLESMLAPLVEETELGTLNVLAIFRNENSFQVVGGKVLTGKMENGAEVRVVRNKQTIATGRVGQLQSNKLNAKEVTEGNECGLKVEGVTGIQVGDRLQAFTQISKRRKLSDRV
jgi:translation initiation factor IF-2